MTRTFWILTISMLTLTVVFAVLHFLPGVAQLGDGMVFRTLAIFFAMSALFFAFIGVTMGKLEEVDRRSEERERRSE